VVTESGVEGKPLKATTKSCKDEWEADRLVEKTLSPKLLQGYTHVRPLDEVEDGAVFFAARPPGAGSGEAFDVDPSGRVAFLASGRGDPRASVAWVDLRTGVTTARPMNASKYTQLYAHGAFVSADGRRGFYALNDLVYEQVADTGAERELSSIRGEPMNSHCVQPDIDQARGRLLVADKKSTLCVLDLASMKDLCRVTVGTAVAECRAIGLSPSGKLFAAYVTSSLARDESARNDTNEVLVFRADDGKPVAKVPVTGDVRRLSVAWDDAGLWVDTEYGSQMQLLDFKGKEKAALPEASGRGGWTYSFDGKHFASSVGACKVELFDTSTWKRVGEVAITPGMPGRLVLSPDGRSLFIGGNGLVEGRRMPAFPPSKAKRPRA
jgi:hypothetical protein